MYVCTYTFIDITVKKEAVHNGTLWVTGVRISVGHLSPQIISKYFSKTCLHNP